MRSNLFPRALLSSLFFICLAGSSVPVAAQDAGNAPTDTHDDGGFDKGLLGLAGLAGLLGLRRRDRQDTKRAEFNRDDVNQSATSRV